jgi:hypothetical protein
VVHKLEIGMIQKFLNLLLQNVVLCIQEGLKTLLGFHAPFEHIVYQGTVRKTSMK